MRLATGMNIAMTVPPAHSEARLPVAPQLNERIGALLASVRELGCRRPRPRPERLSGMHNPWGHAAVLASAWRFLDLCEDAALLDSVEQLIGPDIILWDSELHLEAVSYIRFVEDGREGRYWPSTPLAGAVVLIAPGRPEEPALCLALANLDDKNLSRIDPAQPLYVIRYMPATSLFVRDPRVAPNWLAMQEQPLLNFTTRPIWLMRGQDRASNDFVAGFAPSVPRWAGIKTKEN